MSCPEIQKIAQDEPDEATAAHLAACASCRERREKLSRLLAFPASAEPPPFVLPQLLAKIDASLLALPRTHVARPARFSGSRRLVAAVFGAALLGSTLLVLTSHTQAEAKEKRLETVVVESEWRGLGYSSEADFRA